MFNGPDGYALADWRRRINDLYADIRAAGSAKAGWDLWLSTRSTLFRDHPMSPLSLTQREGFTTIPVFDYDPGMRFTVDLTEVKGETVSLDLGQDGRISYRQIAKTDGLSPKLGRELAVYWVQGYGGGLFIPFKDGTSRSETYGGGRYLVDAINGSDLGPCRDGRLILDFNFAYNPSCALNDNYVCPLAPEENTLPVPIRAGEKIL